MSYALYEGDSRSSWERLDWVSWQNDHVRTAPVPERKKEVDDLHGITREVKSLIIESKDIPPKKLTILSTKDGCVLAMLSFSGS